MNENENSIENLTDELLSVLKKAIKQSKNTLLKSKKKVVSTEYDEEIKKPTLEITEETEGITKLKGMVDINSLKTIAGLLKDISDMTGNEGVTEDEMKGIIVLADVKDLEENEA